MTDTIHVDQFLSQPPAAVWRALTEPDRLAKWWAAGDIAPVVGHRFTLDMGGWGEVPCTVTEVEPERRISYTFAESTMDWTVTWRLVAEGAGTRLFLEHAGFDLADPKHEQAYRNMSRGWPGSVLPRLLREMERVTA
ncbi:MAG: SRPBCC domain-containing protein [Actinophytocola sp.]|uniref:SRPBCC family protein n=1 Tax=Actinophytocola sp. TaxID=1872138 RepID=UPI00132CA861|nr:SRPBCC domain-containing protein [Actinophytocola sp.]MPZ83839.1 SRPBCC domain-containing protein [Actinophytocola sp.]